MLTSSSFGQSSDELYSSIANVTKKLKRTVYDTSLESLLVSCLIPLDKDPGLRPIGVGEVLHRIIGKSVMSTICESVANLVGSLQVCAGHEAGSEAAVHAMREIYNELDTEAVLLTDASNTFNTINRKVFLHNISVVCPEIATYVKNCYSQPLQLFVIGGVELSSSEGTTQGDPVTSAVYATSVIPLIIFILEITDISYLTKERRW